LRVRADGGRHRINLGTELDGWTEARAKIELQNMLEDPGRHLGAARRAVTRS
jgi:hypothetical protein